MSKDYGVITRSRSKSTSVMSKNEVEAILESMLAPIKRKLEEIVTEESMITHLKDLETALLGKIVEQKREIDALNVEKQLLTGRVAILENTMTIQERKIDDIEQYGRRVCLRVEDMPLQQNETEQKLMDQLENEFSNMGLDVTASAIERLHRIGPIYSEEDEDGKQYERQQVIVKFKNWGSRTKVYKNRKKSNKFKFRVDLTKRRLLLLKKARDMTKNMPNVDFTFSDVNCRLALRLTNGDFKFFNSETELASIIANL